MRVLTYMCAGEPRTTRWMKTPLFTLGKLNSRALSCSIRLGVSVTMVSPTNFLLVGTGTFCCWPYGSGDVLPALPPHQ